MHWIHQSSGETDVLCTPLLLYQSKLCQCKYKLIHVGQFSYLLFICLYEW